MSAGIMCMHDGCRRYARFRVYSPDNRSNADVCEDHLPESSDNKWTRALTNQDHNDMRNWK
jgi:hypothetical protein